MENLFAKNCPGLLTTVFWHKLYELIVIRVQYRLKVFYPLGRGKTLSLQKCSATNSLRWDEFLNLVLDRRDPMPRQVRRNIPRWRNNRNLFHLLLSVSVILITLPREMLTWASSVAGFLPTKCIITGCNMHLHAGSYKSTPLSESDVIVYSGFFKIHVQQPFCNPRNTWYITWAKKMVL